MIGNCKCPMILRWTAINGIGIWMGFADAGPNLPRPSYRLCFKKWIWKLGPENAHSASLTTFHSDRNWRFHFDVIGPAFMNWSFRRFRVWLETANHRLQESRGIKGHPATTSPVWCLINKYNLVAFHRLVLEIWRFHESWGCWRWCSFSHWISHNFRIFSRCLVSKSKEITCQLHRPQLVPALRSPASRVACRPATPAANWHVWNLSDRTGWTKKNWGWYHPKKNKRNHSCKMASGLMNCFCCKNISINIKQNKWKKKVRILTTRILGRARFPLSSKATPIFFLSTWTTTTSPGLTSAAASVSIGGNSHTVTWHTNSMWRNIWHPIYYMSSLRWIGTHVEIYDIVWELLLFQWRDLNFENPRNGMYCIVFCGNIWSPFLRGENHITEKTVYCSLGLDGWFLLPFSMFN